MSKQHSKCIIICDPPVSEQGMAALSAVLGIEVVSYSDSTSPQEVMRDAFVHDGKNLSQNLLYIMGDISPKVKAMYSRVSTSGKLAESGITVETRPAAQLEELTPEQIADFIASTYDPSVSDDPFDDFAMLMDMEDEGVVIELEPESEPESPVIAEEAPVVAAPAPELPRIQPDAPIVIPNQVARETPSPVITETFKPAPKPADPIPDHFGVIRVTEGKLAGLEIALAVGESILGRAPEGVDVRVNDPSVSRKHAKIIVSPHGVLTITDLGSANGLVVNDSRVNELVVHELTKIDLGDVTIEVEPPALGNEEGALEHTMVVVSTPAPAPAPMEPAPVAVPTPQVQNDPLPPVTDSAPPLNFGQGESIAHRPISLPTPPPVPEVRRDPAGPESIQVPAPPLPNGVGAPPLPSGVGAPPLPSFGAGPSLPGPVAPPIFTPDPIEPPPVDPSRFPATPEETNNRLQNDLMLGNNGLSAKLFGEGQNSGSGLTTDIEQQYRENQRAAGPTSFTGNGQSSMSLLTPGERASQARQENIMSAFGHLDSHVDIRATCNMMSKIFYVTGSHGGTGKTTWSWVLANVLAVAYRQLGISTPVFLIEADYRNSKLASRISSSSIKTLGDAANYIENLQEQNAITPAALFRVIENIATVQQDSGLNVIPCPYDLGSVNEESLKFAIMTAARVAVNKTTQGIAFVDSSTLTSGKFEQLDSVFMKMASGMVLVTQPNEEHANDAARTFQLATQGDPRLQPRQVYGVLNKATVEEVKNYQIDSPFQIAGYFPEIRDIAGSWVGNAKPETVQAMTVRAGQALVNMGFTELRELFDPQVVSKRGKRKLLRFGGRR